MVVRSWQRRAVGVAAAMVVLAACGGSPAVPAVRIEHPAAEVAVELGVPVEFRGSGSHPSGDPVELTWELGDGTTATGPAPPAHSYRDPGTYLVTLNGRGSDGAAAIPVTRVVRVGASPGGSGNSAMAFGGTGRDDIDRVKIPMRDADDRSTGANVGATDTTIELWLRAEPGANPAAAVECGEGFAWIHGNIVLDRDRFNQGRKYGLSLAGGMLVFGVTNGARESHTVCGGSRVDDGRWHHVAVTRSAATGALRLYVDGRPDGELESGPAGDISYPAGAVPEAACDGGRPCTRSDPFLVIGAEKHDAGPEYPSFRGMVDELRLSTAIRYPGPFDPPQRRFSVDAETAALYHFDEGGGPVVRDEVAAPASPADGVVRVGGNPGGPVWTPSDAPTGA